MLPTSAPSCAVPQTNARPRPLAYIPTTVRTILLAAICYEKTAAYYFAPWVRASCTRPVTTYLPLGSPLFRLRRMREQRLLYYSTHDARGGFGRVGMSERGAFLINWTLADDAN